MRWLWRGYPDPINGIVTSPDQTLLMVSDTRGRFIYSFQVQPDGTLRHKQPYGHLHLPDDATDSGADGMTMDSEGRLYATSRLGIQILDQLGRCHLILSKPDGGWLSNVVFAGPKRDILYVTCGQRVYRRRLKAQGIVSWEVPVLAPRPRL